MDVATSRLLMHAVKAILIALRQWSNRTKCQKTGRTEVVDQGDTYRCMEWQISLSLLWYTEHDNWRVETEVRWGAAVYSYREYINWHVGCATLRSCVDALFIVKVDLK